MPRIPGVTCEQAIRAFGKVGFTVIREGKHVIMSNGTTRLAIPRHSPINAFTMGGIAREAGLTPKEFLKLV